MQIKFDLANKYRKKGWSVFPVILTQDPNGKVQKKPAVAWREYINRLPTEQELRSWFGSERYNGIGLATGAVSGVVVIDVEADAEPETVKFFDRSPFASRTISGGWHFYFKATEALRNTVRLDDKLVDFRGDGGFVVLPPSGINNKAYAWHKTQGGLDALPPLPTEIIKMLQAQNTTKGKPVFDFDQDEYPYPDVYEGGRNDAATQVIGSILARVPRKQWNVMGWATAKDWNNNHCFPPLSEDELKTTWDSVVGTEKRANPDGREIDKPDGEEIYQVLKGSESLEVYKKMEAQFGDGVTTGFAELDDFFKFLPQQLYLVSAPTHQGKCLGKNEKIIMYDGSIKKVQDIKTGDLLMGDDSTPRMVLSTTKGEDHLYKIIPNKGKSFVVNKPHVLSLRKTGSNNIIDIPLNEYIDKSNNFKHIYKGYRTGVEFKEKELTIDPYFLGIWLGDGNSGNVGVTTTDDEIIDYLYSYAQKLNLKVYKTKQKDRTTRYSITKGELGKNNKLSLQKLLREINVLNNKHIPFEYKTASRKQRLELLAGLIDSDGYKNDKSYVFSNSNEILIDDVVYLAQSLGFVAYKKRNLSHGFGMYRQSFRVSILGDCHKIPVLVKRKFCGERKTIVNHLNFGFKIQYIGKGEYFGFMLDGNGRFLLDDFTVTHNTTFALNMAARQASLGINVLFASLEQGVFIAPRVLTMLKSKEYPESLSLLVSEDMATVTGIIKLIEQMPVKPDVVMVDHLHFVKKKNTKSTTEGMDDMIIQLQNMAKRLNLPVLIIAHLRKLNADRPPELDDLRDSSSLQQVPSVILLMHRKKSESMELGDSFLQKEGKLYIGKNRIRGKTGSIHFRMEDSGEMNFGDSFRPPEEEKNYFTPKHFPYND